MFMLNIKRAKFCKSVQLGDYSSMKTEEDTEYRSLQIKTYVCINVNDYIYSLSVIKASERNNFILYFNSNATA